MDGPEQMERRMTELELLFTHLERQVAELHEVALGQQQRIDSLEKQVRRWTSASQARISTPEEDGT